MISVKVKSARGEVIRRIPVDPDFDPVLSGIDASVYPHLSVIDPYGDTVFNYLQVKRLLVELELYRQACEISPEFLENMREMCELVLAGTHRFLWFIGE